MTFLPKGQLIGIYSPDTLYPVSIGSTPYTYTDLGVVSAGNINVIINIGNGIALAGTSDWHIFRSTDYGSNWFDLGIISASAINTFSYIGNGIVIFGNSGGEIRRSTDFGITWSAALFTAGAAIYSSAYLGGGVVLAGTGTFGVPAIGHIIQSLDYGASWADVAVGGITVGGFDAGIVDSIIFIDSPSVTLGPIVIFTDSNGRVFRSTDGGSNWTTVTNVSVDNALLVSVYIGKDTVITVDNNGAIFRSIDRGVTWVAATISGAPVTAPTTIIYLGSGIVVHGGFSSTTKGSYNFGLSWADFSISASGTTVTALAYLGNGVVVTGGVNGHIFISDIAYKSDEHQVLLERPVTIVNADITVGQSHDTIIVDSPGADRIVTLQDAQLPGMTGHEFTIVNIATDCIVTIATVNNRTINGYLNPTLDIQWQSMTVKSNGVNWNIT